MAGESGGHRNDLSEQALPVGTVLSGGQFTITGQLGAGGFGVTYRATDNVLGREIVIKECFPADLCHRDGTAVVSNSPAHASQMRSVIEMFMREARSLAKLRHPNVVGVHRAFEENKTAYMVLDLIDGQDLSVFIGSKEAVLSPARIKDILLQLLDAIEKVHKVDLLHRDISPDNILIEKSGAPVLIDFGSARGDASRNSRAVSSLLVVKDGYSPQELYVPGSEQTPCSDLYSLAATFHHLIAGQAPVQSQMRMSEVAAGRPDPCVPLAGRIEGYSSEFLEAIDTAMDINPSRRLQTAAKWKSMIADADCEELARHASLVRPTSKDLSLDLELSLTRLVKETNHEVSRSSASPEPTEVAASVPKEPAKPVWIDEFNKESLSLSSEPPSIGGEPEEACAPEPRFGDIVPSDIGAPSEPGTTDWIGRAYEKQEILRAERERSLGLFDEETTSDVGSAFPDAASDPSEEGAGQMPPISHQPSRYRPLGILFLLISFCFVFFIETP